MEVELRCRQSLAWYFYVRNVGQGSVKEINLIAKGENYGWQMFEGARKFSDRLLVGGLPSWWSRLRSTPIPSMMQVEKRPSPVATSCAQTSIRR